MRFPALVLLLSLSAPAWAQPGGPLGEDGKDVRQGRVLQSDYIAALREITLDILTSLSPAERRFLENDSSWRTHKLSQELIRYFDEKDMWGLNEGLIEAQADARKIKRLSSFAGRRIQTLEQQAFESAIDEALEWSNSARVMTKGKPLVVHADANWGKRLGRLPHGTTVAVLAKNQGPEGLFHKIRAGNRVGFVHRNYLLLEEIQDVWGFLVKGADEQGLRVKPFAPLAAGSGLGGAALSLVQTFKQTPMIVRPTTIEAQHTLELLLKKPGLLEKLRLGVSMTGLVRKIGFRPAWIEPETFAVRGGIAGQVLDMGGLSASLKTATEQE